MQFFSTLKTHENKYSYKGIISFIEKEIDILIEKRKKLCKVFVLSDLLLIVC